MIFQNFSNVLALFHFVQSIRDYDLWEFPVEQKMTIWLKKTTVTQFYQEFNPAARVNNDHRSF